MMGERDPQKQLWSYQVNLDKRVRSDRPLRRINETLELDFVRREVAQFYGTNGNVSEDPVVIMKMMLLLFLDNVRSERELMRIIPERLDYVWFPNHSVLSKARKRWGEEVFVAFFSRVVAQCVRAGLLEGTKIHADSSLVDANASLNSVRELDAATLDQIRRACREQTEKLEEADTKKNEADDDQYPNIPGPGPRTEINQKYQSNIESGLRRTIKGRDMVMRSLIRAVYRFRDATLVAEKKDDFQSRPSKARTSRKKSTLLSSAIDAGIAAIAEQRAVLSPVFLEVT